jgi:hypothetical protein
MKVIRICMKVIRILKNGSSSFSLVEYDGVGGVSVLLPAHGVIRIHMKVIRIRMKVIRIRMKVIRIRMKPDPDPQELLLTCRV